MPGCDGTGPRGEGPMTGGGRGRCNPTGKNAMRQGRLFYGAGRGGLPFGGGRGRCFGGGRGLGFNSSFSDSPTSQTNERQVLSEQITVLEQELEATKDKLREIESEKDEAK